MRMATELVPKRRSPTVWARMAAVIVTYAEQQGAEVSRLLEAAGLTRPALAHPDGRIPLVAFYDLIEATSSELRDPCLGLHLTTTLEVADLDALGFLMITSSTFGNALERMLRYQRVWAEGEHFELVHDGELIRVTYEQYGPTRPAHVQMAQMGMTDFVVNGGRLVPGVRFERVRFRHAEPAQIAEYQRVLGVPLEFGVGVDEALFPARMLDLPMPDANPALNAFFDRYTRDKLNGLPTDDSVLSRVRDRLRKQLPDGQIKVDQIAEVLHMSSRTLQRRLSEEGTSLQHELDEVRRQQALYFLESGVAIAELSWLLGYSEPSVFHRAFRRWTSTSPEAWRASKRREVQ
jgi:AraC-like DNA-binding protein